MFIILIQILSTNSHKKVNAEEGSTYTYHRKLMGRIKEDIKSSRPIDNVQHRFYIKLPCVEDHRNHLKGQVSVLDWNVQVIDRQKICKTNFRIVHEKAVFLQF